MVQPPEVVELYSVLSQKADSWYSNSLERMGPGMTQELSYAAHCLSLEYKIKIMGWLKLDIQQKEKDMAGYLIRLLSVDSVIHTLSVNWKRRFIDMLENIVILSHYIYACNRKCFCIPLFFIWICRLFWRENIY